MTITANQLAARQQGIGSSDAAAILGYSPWRTPEDIRLIKLGLVEPEPPGELAEIGTALEGGIAEIASKRLGCRLVKPTSTYVRDILRVNVDRQVEKAAKGQPIVECKDSGIDEAWGEPGTSEVPAYVLIQVVIQMWVAESNLAHVARLNRGFNRGLSVYTIERNADVARLMAVSDERLNAWHEKHIVNGEPADDRAKPANWDILKRIRREPKSIISINSDLVRQWRDDDEKARIATDKADQSKRRVIGALKDHECGVCELGTVTYLEQERREYTAPATKFRVARFKPQN